jgi:hypothetical protein
MSYHYRQSQSSKRLVILSSLFLAALCPAAAKAADHVGPSVLSELLPLGLTTDSTRFAPVISFALSDHLPIRFSVSLIDGDAGGFGAYYQMAPDVSMGVWTGAKPFAGDFAAGLGLQLEF